MISKPRADYLAHLLANGVRADGRLLDEQRDVICQANVLGASAGSARAELGETRVTCSIGAMVLSEPGSKSQVTVLATGLCRELWPTVDTILASVNKICAQAIDECLSSEGLTLSCGVLQPTITLVFSAIERSSAVRAAIASVNEAMAVTRIPNPEQDLEHPFILLHWTPCDIRVTSRGVEDPTEEELAALDQLAVYLNGRLYSSVGPVRTE